MSKMTELACMFFQAMIDNHKIGGSVGDPHGIEITKIERVEDAVRVYINNDGTKTTYYEPQFMVWIWHEGGGFSPNPSPQLMTLHTLMHKMIWCAGFCNNSRDYIPFVDEHFPDKKVRSDNTIVGNVYKFGHNDQHYVVADKKGDNYIVVPFDRKLDLVGDYDCLQANFVYRLKHRVELPLAMFSHFSKKFNWQVDKIVLSYLHEECLEEINDKIKMIEESPDPDNFKDEELDCVGDKEEYLLVEKKLTQEKESLLNEVRLLQED